MAKTNLFRDILLPTSLIALSCTGTIIWSHSRSDQQERAAIDLRQARSNETYSVIQQVAERSNAAGISGAVTISLRQSTNCTLADSFVPKRASDNNLEELPTGTHVFGGVPFDVEGRIQLWGQGIASLGLSFPKKVEGIPITGKCSKIHLLHGALFIKDLDTTIAQLVLHYKDGSQGRIDIVAGEHVLDWWGPLYKKGISGNAATVTDPGSELAWVGTNPYIRARKPNFSIRLYKSTFQNPRPDVDITDIDYKSAETPTAPFLLGLTIE